MSFSVLPLTTGKELRRFIRLPYHIYRDDPVWIPPLLMEEKKSYNPKKNHLFQHCLVQHFLLLDGNRPVGRISAFVNHLANQHWQREVGLFGSYECQVEGKGPELLLGAAADFLRTRGMKFMQGPWSFTSQEFGLLVEGFQTQPMIMAPYNPPSYQEHFQNFGLNKIKDLLVYEANAQGYHLPERFMRFAEQLERKKIVRIRPIDMKNLNREVDALLSVANASTSANWGYVPVTDEEASDLADSLKMIADPEVIMLAEAKDRPVGYLIALPDINTLLRGCGGHLLPKALFRLVFGLRRIRDYRIWALGIVPEYQRKGLDTLFYARLYRTLKAKNASRVEANYVLEDNMPMNNAIRKMGFSQSKRYRVFEKKV